jgi:hypothetical protein
MLSPKRVKFRKMQKGRRAGTAQRGAVVEGPGMGGGGVHGSAQGITRARKGLARSSGMAKLTPW